MSNPRTLLVAVTLDARHAGATPSEIGRVASLLDEAGVDLLLLGGAAPGLDPLVVAGWLATRTRRIGLVSAVPALTTFPFHVARALSTLDVLSGGRGGWSPTTLGHAEQAAAIGPHAHIDSDEALAKAVDFIDATCRLWDSWDSGALVIDKASGVYLDADRVRRVHYKGPYFQTMGPLNAPRPPQGYPVLVQHDDDPLWERTMGRADVIVTSAGDDAALVERRSRIAAAGGTARLLVSVDPDGGGSTKCRVDHLQTAFEAGLIDGVCLAPGDEASLDALVSDVLPELGRRGLLDRPALSGSLRSRLGLPDHANSGPARRFASQAVG